MASVNGEQRDLKIEFDGGSCDCFLWFQRNTSSAQTKSVEKKRCTTSDLVKGKSFIGYLC